MKMRLLPECVEGTTTVINAGSDVPIFYADKTRENEGLLLSLLRSGRLDVLPADECANFTFSPLPVISTSYLVP